MLMNEESVAGRLGLPEARYRALCSVFRARGVAEDAIEAAIGNYLRALRGIDCPSDQELRAMQQRGAMRSDEELAREIP
jgi:hypothetical protein